VAEEATTHECDAGWRWVSQSYAEHIAADVVVEGDTPAAAVIAALRNSVYPCRICHPQRFFRWAEGHFRPDHDLASCPDCIAAHGGVKSAKRHAHGGRRTHEPPPLGDEHAPPPEEEHEPPPTLDLPDLPERKDLA
jgi:hypothetical protein